MNRETPPSDFDALAIFAAMDAQRTRRGINWRQVADEIWDQSNLLNEQRRDHPISPSTLTGIAKRGDTTCQHALFILRWLARTPESFLAIAQQRGTTPFCHRPAGTSDCVGILERCTRRWTSVGANAT